MKWFILLYCLIFMLMDLRAQNSSELNINKIEVTKGELSSKDTVITQLPKYLYYDISLISGGGALSKTDYLDFDLLDFSFGYGFKPILFGFKIIEFQTILPWGSESMFTHSINARYIWGAYDQSIIRYMYIDLNWGNYSKEIEENLGYNQFQEEQKENKYSCLYFDIGFGAIIHTVDFEIGSFPLNGIKAQLGFRFGNTKGDIKNQMFGLYASAKFRLGWFGAKLKN